MKNREEANQKVKDFFNWFMEVRKDFPNVELDKNGNDLEYQVFFIGDKKVGSDYELTCWKAVPILQCGVRQYSETHPTKSNQYYLELRLNFRGSSSSQDGELSELDFKEQVRKAFIGASKDFLTEKI
jgi:hypothetical protein